MLRRIELFTSAREALQVLLFLRIAASKNTERFTTRPEALWNFREIKGNTHFTSLPPKNSKEKLSDHEKSSYCNAGQCKMLQCRMLSYNTCTYSIFFKKKLMHSVEATDPIFKISRHPKHTSCHISISSSAARRKGQQTCDISWQTVRLLVRPHPEHPTPSFCPACPHAGVTTVTDLADGCSTS